MDATNNLRNIAGYRAKSINALNSAVIQNRIIGGDASPIVSANGTTLRIAQSNNIKRFELYSGIANTDGELYTTMCVSDGALYDNFNLKTLKNVVNTQYTSTGIMPRSSGWYCKGTHPSQWETCTVEILRYQGEYYIAFHFNGQLYSELIEGAQDADVELVVVIGVFHNEGAIAQYIAGDIYIGAEAVEDTSIRDWTVALNNGVWQVYNPRIQVISPPAPDKGYEGLWNAPTMGGYNVGLAGSWVNLADIYEGEIGAGYLNVSLDPMGLGDATLSIEAEMQTTTTRKWSIGRFVLGSGNQLSFIQLLDGEIILDASHQTPQFIRYGANECSPNFKDNKTGSVYVGCTFWLEHLLVNGVIRASAIVKNASNAPQVASNGAMFAIASAVYMQGDMKMSSSSGLIPTATGGVTYTERANKVSTPITTNVGANTPTSTSQQGEVYAEKTSAYIWIGGQLADTTHTTLLYTEVEEANDSSTYSANAED